MLNLWHLFGLAGGRNRRGRPYSLRGPDPSFFGDLDCVDTSASDGEVLVRVGNFVSHFEWFG
jgi:hypothetical protein